MLIKDLPKHQLDQLSKCFDKEVGSETGLLDCWGNRTLNEMCEVFNPKNHRPGPKSCVWEYLRMIKRMQKAGVENEEDL